MANENTNLLFSKFLQLNKLPLLICDSEGYIMDYNQPFLELKSNFSKNVIDRLHWTKLLHFDNSKVISELFNQALNSPRLFAQNCFLYDENNKTILVEAKFTAIEFHKKYVAISIEVLTPPQIINANQKRIDFLTKQSIIFKIFNRVKSLDELIKNIIQQIYYLTHASDVWLAEMNADSYMNIYFGLNCKKEEVKDFKIPFYTIYDIAASDTPIQNGVYYLNQNNMIRFSSKIDFKEISEQLVLFFKIPSGLIFTIGLNYYQKPTDIIESDRVFLNSLFPILYPTIENFVAKARLVESELKFRNIFNNSNDSIIITDLLGNVLEINQLTIDRGNLAEKEMESLHLNSFFKEDVSTKVNEYINEIVNKGSTIREIVMTNSLNQILSIEINGKLIEYQGQSAILHVSRDISLRKELQRKVLEARIKTEEGERSRFARDLHDGIGPYLSATKFFLQTISIEENTEARNAIVEKALHSIDEIIVHIKEISNNLSPHVLKNFGIIAALKSFYKKIEQRIKIKFDTNIESNRYEEMLEISIFRILIELTNNTVKYGCASTIVIEINQINEELYVGYSDNGAGFDYEKIVSLGKGNGIRNIQSRVSSLGGRCEFITSTQKSFRFIAIFNAVPVNPVEKGFEIV